MPEAFRDNEERERFELDVDGPIAFVTYRKSDGAITLVHTEVPPELGGRGIGSKLGRATLDAVRTQGRKLSVECDFIRNFMRKDTGYNDLLADGGDAHAEPQASYRAGCFCGAVEVEVTGKAMFSGYCLRAIAIAPTARRGRLRRSMLSASGSRTVCESPGARQSSRRSTRPRLPIESSASAAAATS